MGRYGEIWGDMGRYGVINEAATPPSPAAPYNKRRAAHISPYLPISLHISPSNNGGQLSSLASHFNSLMAGTAGE